MAVSARMGLDAQVRMPILMRIAFMSLNSTKKYFCGQVQASEPNKPLVGKEEANPELLTLLSSSNH